MDNEKRRNELRSMLEEIIPYIKGEWFLGKGGLLGIVREGDLILGDHDLDLYLLPETTIELPEGWERQRYYVDEKIYRKKNFPVKLNTWFEYMNLTKTKYNHLNRSEIMVEAKKTYHTEKITPYFTDPFIDIYYLEKKNDIYEVPFWTEYYNTFFTIEEAENLEINKALGFEIKIPGNAEDFLQRHFGKDWRVPNDKYKKKINKVL